MLSKSEIISLLQKHLPGLQEKYPLKTIALFGSYARGEQRTNSDIDLLVEFTEPVGMEIVDLVLELEEILDQPVDVVTYNAIKNRLFHRIKDELTYA